jgi:hypothetical protein
LVNQEQTGIIDQKILCYSPTVKGEEGSLIDDKFIHLFPVLSLKGEIPLFGIGEN